MSLPARLEPQAALAMEFADSEIRQALRRGDDLLVRFSAVAATRQAPGEAAISGFLQGVELVLHGCTLAATAALVGRLRSGVLRLEGQPPVRRIAVPSVWQQPITLELEPAQAGVQLLQAHGMECRLQTGGAFRESLFC